MNRKITTFQDANPAGGCNPAPVVFTELLTGVSCGEVSAGPTTLVLFTEVLGVPFTPGVTGRAVPLGTCSSVVFGWGVRLVMGTVVGSGIRSVGVGKIYGKVDVSVGLLVGSAVGTVVA
jgi:hypothetical protein